MLTGEQIRAARALLRLEQADLAARARVSVETIKRLEKCDGVVRANLTTVTQITRALADAGVILIAENGEGPGVRLKKRG